MSYTFEAYGDIQHEYLLFVLKCCIVPSVNIKKRFI